MKVRNLSRLIHNSLGESVIIQNDANTSCFIRQTSPSLVRFLPPHGPPLQEITGVEPLHEQVIRILGPLCAKLYEPHT